MANELTQYTFAGVHKVRVVKIDGEPCFAAKDVCAILGLKNTTQAIRPLGTDEKGFNLLYTPGGLQNLYTLSESGLYKLIL